MRERVKRASAQNHRVFAVINTGVADVGGRKQCTTRHPAGRRPGAVRTPALAPAGRRAVHLFIGRSPEAYRKTARHPAGTRPAPLQFVDGRLAITLHRFSPDTARAP